MKQLKEMTTLTFALFALLFATTAKAQSQPAPAQEKKVQASLYDGIIITGYVNNGGFLNYTGPNLSITKGPRRIMIGMLPSLRFKEDKSTPSNSFVIPSLGTGITFCYKAFAMQVPIYYNAKTATTDGRWHLGIGVGFRPSHFNKPK